MVVEFLAFEGCPHAPILRKRLDEAIQALGLRVIPVSLDLEMLSRSNDTRSGFGSPTILVDGFDLFGMATSSEAAEPACRLYRPELPSLSDVIQRLRDKISGVQHGSSGNGGNGCL